MYKARNSIAAVPAPTLRDGARGVRFIGVIADSKHMTTVAIAVLAMLGSVIVYLPTIRYGFDYDDYHWIRPFSLSEVLASFWGTWDRTHIEVVFYRPLTVVLYALRFQAFGYQSGAYHAASIVMFALAATLLGAFLLRLSRSRALAFAGTVLFLVYPGMADTLVAWTIQQYQLLQLILILCALHCWVRGRSTSVWRWWLPVVGLQALCFLVKEDGIMLGVAIILIHLADQWVLGRGAKAFRALRWVSVSAVIVVLALVIARTLALHGILGGYGTPSLHRIKENELGGLRTILFGQYGVGWPRLLNTLLVVTLTLLGATLAIIRKDRIGRFLLLAGAVIVVVFNLPFALSTKPQQYHLLALGAVLMLCGALATLGREVMRARGTWVWVAAFALVSVGIYCGLLAMRPALRLDYTPDNLDPRAFNAAQTDAAGNRYVWTRERAPFVFDTQPRRPVSLAIDVRSAAVAGGPDALIRVYANEKEIAEIHPEPTNADFQTFHVTFIPPPWSLDQLRVELVTPTFTPAKDRRILGTMVRRVSLDETGAWAGFEQYRWLFLILPILAVGALGFGWSGHRLQSARRLSMAAACCLGALLCCSALGVGILRTGTLDPNAYWAWAGGLLYFGATALVAGYCLMRAQQDARARLSDSRDRFSAPTSGWRPLRLLPEFVFFICVAALIFNMNDLTHQRAAQFHPYSEATLIYDDEVLGWSYQLPPPLQLAIARKLPNAGSPSTPTPSAAVQP